MPISHNKIIPYRLGGAPMDFHHLIHVQARPGRSAQLGAYLRDLLEPTLDMPGCVAFAVVPLPGGDWRLQGRWVSEAARGAFFAAPLLTEVFSRLLQEGLLGSVQSSTQPTDELVAA